MRQWLHDHSLSVIVGGIALFAYTLRQATAYYNWTDESGGWREQVVIHGESVWEVGQFFLAVILTKWFVERGSAESRADTEA